MLLFIVKFCLGYHVSTRLSQHKGIIGPGTLDALDGLHWFTNVFSMTSPVHGFTTVLQINVPPSFKKSTVHPKGSTIGVVIGIVSKFTLNKLDVLGFVDVCV